MASERIRIEGEQIYREPLPAPATHVTLPLDPAQYDDAALADAAVAARKTQDLQWPSQSLVGIEAMRAALAAYARHVAGGAR
jgi:hypothetical protein